MGKINLQSGSIVYKDNTQYKIVRVANTNEVFIENEVTKEHIKVNVFDLSSSPAQLKEKNYLENYSGAEWSEANKRYEIIKDLIFRARTKSEVEQVAKNNSVSTVTIYSWIKLYEQTRDRSSLVPKTSQRGKKGSRLDKDVEIIVQQILEELYLNRQKFSFRRICVKVKTECKKLNLQAPHENTIRNRIDEINPKLAMKKRDGYKASHAKYSNFEGEFPEGNYPLEVVQIDHTPLDIQLVDKVHRNRIGKPYLTLAIDVYSRMIVGIYVSLQAPGYFNVSQCLFNIFTDKNKLLKRYQVDGEWSIQGVPRIAHVDNGSDLVSADMQKVCDELGITLMKRPVARPQFGGHVERALQTINTEVHNLSGTTRSNIVQKGNYDSVKKAIFTLDEITQWILHYIVNIYHKTYHYGIETTPNEKYIQGIFGDDENPGTGVLPSIIDNIEDIKILLLPTYYRTIQRDGITLDGIGYYSDVLRHWIGLEDKDKKKIKHIFKRDPLNIQIIYFYDPELKEYFEVPYRKLSAPVMTLWDLYASKKHLKDNNISSYTEDDIFAAYEVLEKIEAQASQSTKKQRLKKSKPLRQVSQIKEQNTEQKEHQNLNNFSSLFANIKTFDVSYKKVDNDDE